ncbi:MAG TPA: hypothetical protein VNT75_31185 [Symbiobacteriaceae bacterium]|nr:hypothetical protein [Symbiobacteriaceae bacterium]
MEAEPAQAFTQQGEVGTGAGGGGAPGILLVAPGRGEDGGR